MSWPVIDPVALSLGPVKVHWYGIMYLVGFVLAWLLGRHRARRWADWMPEQVDDLVTWCMLGAVLGGRLGYMFFYDLPAFLADPLLIVQLWNGGMSFHGGLLGVVFAVWWWGRRRKKPFLAVLDFMAPLVPPGLFFGRLGNFINGELWGATTALPWGVVFPSGGPLPRHPSQLYEAGLEGLVLFIALWIYSSRSRPPGRVSGLFGLLYGVFRFGLEFVRQPDVQLGYLAFGWLTMGQILCLPLIAAGGWLLLRKAPVAAGGLPAQDSASGDPRKGKRATPKRR